MRAFLLLVVITVLVMSSVVLVATYYAPDQVAARHAEALARQAQAERLQPFDDVLAVGWRLLPLAFASGLAGLGLLAFARRLALVRVAGGPPLPYAGVAAGQYAELSALGMAAHFEVERTRAANPAPALPPNLRSYSPKYVTAAPRVISPAEPRPALAAPGDAGAPVALPGAVDLTHILTTPPTLDRILVGITMAGPVYVAAHQLVHVGLLGRTGTGKSSTLRLIMGQLLATGKADCVLVDPHFASNDVSDLACGDWRPIERRLLAPPASEPAEIREMLEWMNAELKHRLKLRHNGQPVGRPTFICSDEWPAIVDDVPELVEAFTRLLRQGRKVGLYGILSTQSALVKALGDAALRDSLGTAFYGGGDKSGAAVVLDLPRREIDDAALGKGVVLLKSAATPNPVLARLPLASNESLTRLLPAPAAVVSEPAPRRSLAELVNPPRPPLRVMPGGGGMAEDEPDSENEPQTSAADTTTTTTTTTAYDPDADRARRILELHVQGISKSSICQVVFGYKDTRVMSIVNRVIDAAPDTGTEGD